MVDKGNDMQHEYIIWMVGQNEYQCVCYALGVCEVMASGTLHECLKYANAYGKNFVYVGSKSVYIDNKTL